MQPSQTQHLLLRLPLCLLLLLLFLSFLTSPAFAGGHGIRFPLIHRDSIHSPIYPGNLTAYELLQRRLNYSQAHVQGIYYRIRGAGGGNGIVPDDIAPIVSHEEGKFEYLVQVNIGSPPIGQYVQFDTGSDLLWVQCEPYVGSHFVQDPPHYVIGNSTSLSYVPCSDKAVCLPKYSCNSEGRCIAQLNYGDGSWATGYVATETFSFPDENGVEVSIPSITFGCMYSAKEQTFANTRLAGILGMGIGHLSLSSQIAFDRKMGNKFTYCLAPSRSTGVSYLQFGNDFMFDHGDDLVTLDLVWNSHIKPYYYVNLTGISCDYKRLNVARSVLALNQADGSGGCLVDTGAAMTYLIEPAFKVLETFIVRYFRSSAAVRLRAAPFNICYVATGLMRQLPSLTFHFGSQVLTLEAHHIWETFETRDGTVSCLGILPSPLFTLIGANAQADLRVVIDREKSTLTAFRSKCGIGE